MALRHTQWHVSLHLRLALSTTLADFQLRGLRGSAGIWSAAVMRACLGLPVKRLGDLAAAAGPGFFSPCGLFEAARLQEGMGNYRYQRVPVKACL